MKKNKVSLFISGILITIIFVFFSIPRFMEGKKIEELLTRINSYQNNNENNDGSFNIDKPDSTNGNHNTANNEQSNNSNSNKDGNQNSSIENNSSGDSQNNNNEQSPIMIKRSVQFYENGAVSISEKEKSCEGLNGSCKITFPSIVSNKSVMGWNEDKNATSATYKPGETVSINTNKTFYAITSKTLSVVINGNGAFSGSKNIACTIYNTATMCSITLPSLEKDFYTTFGYNRNPATDKIEYQENQTLTINQNLELYAVRKINTTEFDNYSNVAQEVFRKINDLRQSKGLNLLNWSKSLELSAMLRVNELKQNYDFNVNGDYHYRISNSQPFSTVNALAKRENYYSVYKILNADEVHNTFYESTGHYNNMVASSNTLCGIAIGFDGEWYYIVELFG